MMGSCTKLCKVAFGFAFGMVSGLSMMLFAWAGYYWGFGSSIVDQWASIFPGYSASVMGGFVGFGWGFLEGFVMGVLVAFFYNLCLCCCKACYGSCESDKKM
jgi:hypothetical protein